MHFLKHALILDQLGEPQSHCLQRQTAKSKGRLQFLRGRVHLRRVHLPNIIFLSLEEPSDSARLGITINLCSFIGGGKEATWWKKEAPGAQAKMVTQKITLDENT
ncbi:hypothetical protein M0R45_016355 [Rubus argutus]|uniref:Uncharacterized protein n=1 Tax=Rubus argutus TaxID=59490 RepID=A0AAW1XTD4_RUBAR